MLDTDKVSLVLAAQYVGVTPAALEAMEVAGWIKAVDRVARIPIYLGVDLNRLCKAKPEETREQKMQREIREKREAIQLRIDVAADDMNALREHCAHPNAVRIPKSDTGNWDRGQDSYWKECKCHDCGKNWTEDQT